MSRARNQAVEGVERLAELEQTLQARIAAAGEVLKRSDSLDEEQRAEIHAILEAIRHDSVFHARFVASLPEEACHA